jgi:hypothetical protein
MWDRPAVVFLNSELGTQNQGRGLVRRALRGDVNPGIMANLGPVTSLMATQALGERAALEGFWQGLGETLYDVVGLAEENIYLLIGVFVVFAYFMLRKR